MLSHSRSSCNTRLGMSYSYDRRAARSRPEEDEEAKKAKAQRDMAGPIEWNLRGLTLSGPTMKAVEKFKSALLKGEATKSEAKDIVEDLEWDLKNETGGQRNTKKVQSLLDAFKKIHTKL